MVGGDGAEQRTHLNERQFVDLLRRVVVLPRHEQINFRPAGQFHLGFFAGAGGAFRLRPDQFFASASPVTTCVFCIKAVSFSSAMLAMSGLTSSTVGNSSP